MGGGGPGTTTNPQTGEVSSAPVLQGTSPMDTFAGSRQAVIDNARTTLDNQGITGVLQTNPAYADLWAQYNNALAMNPTAPSFRQSEPPPVPGGFQSSVYGDASAPGGAAQSSDAGGLPHRDSGRVDPAIAVQQAEADAAAKAAADAAAAKTAEAQKPITETGTKIWPPGPQWDATDVKSWLTANPHWATAVEVPDKGPPGTPGNSWYQPKGAPL